MGSVIPLLLVLVLSGVLGLAVVWPVGLEPGLLPVTPFSDGHRVALGFGDGSFGARTLPLAGGADFRPLLWPAELLAQAVGPDRALALVFISIPAFNALCGWLLGAALRLGPWSRFVLAASLAWNPWVHTTLANGQLEQAAIGGAALIWAASKVGSPSILGGIGAAFLTGATTFAVAAAAPHVALAGCAGLGALAVWEIARALFRRGVITESPSEPRRLLVTRRVLVLALAAGAALSAARYHAASFDEVVRLFAPFGSTAIEAAAAGARLAPEGDTVKREVRLVDLVVPPEAPPRLARGVVHSGHVGIALVLASLLGLRRDRAPMVFAVFCLTLAFGSSGPYALLERASSTIAQSGTPYRFVIGAVVGLSASAAAFQWRWWSAALVVAGLWAAAWWGDPRSLPLASFRVEHDPSSEVLRGGVGEVLDLPVSGPHCREGATHYLLEATVHRRPLPLVMRPGYDAYVTVEAQARARVIDEGLAACTPEAVAAVRGYATVVAHGHRACNLSPEETACLRHHFGAGTARGKVVWWELAKGP